LDILDSLRYRFQQYHLTPTQFGVPNARPRYYLIAALGGAAPACGDTLPGACSRVEGASVAARTVHSSLYPQSDRDGDGDRQPPLTPLATYLDLSMSAGETAELVVPAAVLAKSASWCFDIIPLPRAPVSVQQVGSESAAASTPTAVAACFTKGYSRYIRGAGSVLLIDDSAAAGVGAAAVGAVAPEERVYRSDWREELCLGGAAAGAATEVNTGPGAESTPAAASVVSALAAEGGRRLRYFSPRELLNLFGFPPRCRFNAPSSSSVALESQPLPAASGMEPAVMGNGGDAQGDIQGELKGKGERNKRVKVCAEKPVTRRQCYELIGNSINVTMTTRLLEHMFKMYPPDMPISLSAKNTN
jgi:site-specific DNA-cytosine methylase